MGLRINTNVAAINAQRNLRTSTVDLRNTFERLASGLRINRASDDSAGLAISEKLRSQIRGYDQAVRNAQDGISLIQTAEGAINETISILQRIRELAIQAANDTYTHDDRLKIQEEIIQLRQELTRIANTSEFNTRKLLDGSLSSSKVGRGPQIDLEQNFRVGDTTATITDIRNFIRGDLIDQTNSIPANISIAGNIDHAFQIRLVALSVELTAGTNPRQALGVQVFSSVTGSLVTFSSAFVNDTTVTIDSLDNGGMVTMINLNLVSGTSVFTAAQITLDMTSIALEDVGKVAILQLTGRRASVTTDTSLTFQIGPNEGQLLRVGIDELTGRSLRMEDISVIGTLDSNSPTVDLSDVMKAQEAIGIVDDALDQTNALRAKLGAVQNRLESTVRTMEIATENLSSAQSRIRDADIAKETAALTRTQIFVQAGTAVLAQANVAPQSALALLQ